jgi:hypothetical protein
MIQNFFMSIIYSFLYQARVFLRISWKRLPGSNTLAYYESPSFTDKEFYKIATWMTASMAKVPLPCIGTAVQSSPETPS